jgi:outer membrane lipoprotein-sorting protein
LKIAALIPFFLICIWPAGFEGSTGADVRHLIEKIESAYADVTNYQATLEVKAYQPSGSFEETLARYTFEKPDRIRLDFKSPHSGMVVIHPHKEAKVTIRPGGLLRFLKIRLAPSSPTLQVSPGQRIDQTDLGLLIRNMSHSLTDHRRGRVEVTADDQHLFIRVRADNHFRAGVVTRYTFRVDKRTWLPVAVEEKTLDGVLERVVFFRDLRVNLSLPDGFFQRE